jgi:hypothetical protein
MAIVSSSDWTIRFAGGVTTRKLVSWYRAQTHAPSQMTFVRTNQDDEDGSDS